MTFDLLDGGHNQIRPDNADTALAVFDFGIADPACGPVFVEGAEPGDSLRIEVLALQHGPYGWTAIFPGFGLLADEFPKPALKMWDLSPAALLRRGEGGTLRAVFKPGVSVPVRQFLGVVGVAPAVAGEELSTIPPYATSGGNMDCRDLGVGSSLWLPVHVPGALFSCGDGHAAQGNGEVCGTAIETPMRATVRLTVEKGGSTLLRRECPHYVTAPRGRRAVEEAVEEDRGEYAALGIHAELREASRMALRGLIDWLEAEKGLSREESYMLASVAASLRMAEVVDMPNYAVACALPLHVFDG